jgi:signal transduction histidine kinase
MLKTEEAVRLAELEAKLAAAEEKLAASCKTTAVLTARALEKQRSQSDAYACFEQNASLQQVVVRKTRELKEQNQRLAEAHAELKSTQSQALQASRLEAIGQLTAGIAHEINTPLQYINLNLEFLSEAFTTVSELAKAGKVDQGEMGFLCEEVSAAFMETVEGLRRVSHIVSALKRFSHTGAESLQPVNLRETIESTITLATTEWKSVAEVEVRFDPDVPPILGRVDDLAQVFLNLIVNAAHAIQDSPSHGKQGLGKISVETSVAVDSVEVRIADTGCGIPPEVAQRIFDPFFTTKAAGRGTGQGLAIARLIVEETHGGKLTFETRIGQGTTFVVHLPLPKVSCK